MGFGTLALTALLADEAKAAGLGSGPQPSALSPQPKGANPLSPKPSHFPAKAKAVIFLYMVGGPSHVETFDPKPELERLDGQPLPSSFGQIKSEFIQAGTPLM